MSSLAARIALPPARSTRPAVEPAPFLLNGKATQVTFFAEGAEIYAQGDSSNAIFQVVYGAVRFRMIAVNQELQRRIDAAPLLRQLLG